MIACACIVAAIPFSAQRAGAAKAASAYASAIQGDAPVAWWRMSSAVHKCVANHCSLATAADALTAEVVGKIRFDAAGPRGEQFPDFAPDNLAAHIGFGRNYLRVKDPGAESVLDFDNGQAITIEAWIQPAPNPKPSYSYIVGKGRTENPGFSKRNQNYSLRLLNRSTSARLSFFFVDAETPDSTASHSADGHRWTSSRAVPLDGRWHHVALVYEFGRPESIRAYVDGVESAGRWELAGPTTKRPIVDDDDLWIGSAMAGRATFQGTLDEVAIYRRTLPAKAIGRHARIFRRDEILEAVRSVADAAPGEHVQVDVFEGVSAANHWDFRPAERSLAYQSDVFALTELPRKYDRRGVIADRRSPIMLHAYCRLTLPPGKYQLAFRSLNSARLYVDDRLLAENPFLPLSSNGHGKVYQLKAPPSGALSLAAGHHEKIVEFTSDGTPRVFSVLAVAGLAGRPMELGEIVVAYSRDGEPFRLLGIEPNNAVATADYRALDDEGWLAFLDYDRARRRRWEARTRRARGAAESEYWRRRHEWARQMLSAQPRPTIPQLDSRSDVASPIDRLIERRLLDENVQPTPPSDDLAFLRRVSLDVIGTIPTPAAIERFLADPPEERRAAAIDRLLEDPGWADHWTGYWQHVLAENPGLTKPSLNNSGPFRWYLHEAFLDNKPFDQFVTELVTMEGGAASGGPAGFSQATNNGSPMAHKAHIVGTAFLAVEMKCAVCHDAPLHASTQQDLYSLAAMLARKPTRVPKSNTVPGTPEQLAHMAVTVSLKPGVPVKPAWPLKDLAPRSVLDEMPDDLVRDRDDSRARLAALVTHPRNERFARVLVNRLWKRYLGRGLVTSLHDWEGNQCSHPDLLAYLADELVQSGYDLKHVARLILNSQAYQRSLAEGDDRAAREALFAAPTPRRMTAEQLVDSIQLAVGKPFDSEELCVNPDGRQQAKSFLNLGTPRRAWEFACTSNERERPSMTLPRAQGVVDLLMAFGWRQNRQEPINQREQDVTPLVPLVLANGEAANRAVDLADHGAIVALCLEEQPVEELVDQIVLRFLSRTPTVEERQRYVALLTEGYAERRTGHDRTPRRVDRSPLAWSNNLDAEANRIGTERLELATHGEAPTRRLTQNWRERVEDLVWVIINSPEFVFVP